MNKTYNITTFGCQMNENDSEKLAGMLDEMGFVPEEDISKAGVVLINTCSVRGTADSRALGNLGHIKTFKKNNPEMILGICGCMMQQKEIVDYIHEKHPQVDIIFGTHNLERFPELLTNYMVNGEKITEILDKNLDSIAEDIPVHHKYDFKSYVTIMQGCNNFCTYCIVPYTRGRERSRRPEMIIEEIKNLVANGTIEVTLLGQNVNSYGNDIEEEDINFANLLREINKIEGLERIRFMSSNPKDFTDDVILAMKESEKVMPSLHLALQSGSSSVLKRMNRHYTKEEAIALINKIREQIPEIAITTDLIVGFPGETEEEFEDTLDLVRQCNFDNAFSFIYSKRTGTVAEKMPDQVDESIKHERISRLLDTLKELAQNQNDSYLNQTYPVLVEEVSDKDESRLSGRTPTGKLVHFPADKSLVGSIVPVKITNVNPYSMIGELVND